MGGPFYIALEGAEGCGKSTHAKRLAEAIGAVVTRETGGTRDRPAAAGDPPRHHRRSTSTIAPRR